MTGGGVTDFRKPVDTRLVIGPNASMSGRQALVFFVGISGVSLGIAMGFAALGFWPVLPFAGLELAALGAALLVVQKRNRYREVLVFEGDSLRVEFGLAGGAVQARSEWPRHLTRAWLERTAHGTQVVLGCGMQRLVIGRCLTDEERASLVARVKELIHPAWLGAAPESRMQRQA
jgi:uncharacterized membrane protein